MEKTKSSEKLGVGRLMIWKSSDVSAAWVNVIALSYLSIYASDTLGLNVGVVGTLLLVSKIVDSFTDVLAGLIVDNTHTKWGKARPYELCIVGQTICTILLFSGNPAWSNTVKCVWIFFMYTLVYSIFATFRMAAYNPYTIRFLHNDPILIRKMQSYGSIVTMVASMGLSVAFPMLMGHFATSAGGWTTLVAIIMIPATLIGILRFIFCKEDPSVDASSKQEPIRIKELASLFRKNKYAWLYAILMLCFNIISSLSINTYYFKWIVGDISVMGLLSMTSIVLLPLMAVFPKIMDKLGSMGKMVFLFSCVGVVGYIIAFFSRANIIGIVIGTLLGGLATLPLSYYTVLFIMNISTYNEMIGLPRMEGSSAILSNFASKLGASLGSWITGMLLVAAGYVSATDAVAQPASALMMIRIVFAIVPAILLVVIGLCALAFSHLEPKAAAFEEQKKLAAEAEKKGE